MHKISNLARHTEIIGGSRLRVIWPAPLVGIKPRRPDADSTGSGVFIHQQHRADRADARDLGKTSAAFIGAMPSHKLSINVCSVARHCAYDFRTGVGHYAVFSGRRRATEVYPRVRGMIQVMN
jgi:hypothetical protein